MMLGEPGDLEASLLGDLHLLASCYGHIGRVAESRAAWEKTLELKPDFPMERRRRILPFRNPEDFERRVEGLRKAGLPL